MLRSVKKGAPCLNSTSANTLFVNSLSVQNRVWIPIPPKAHRPLRHKLPLTPNIMAEKVMLTVEDSLLSDETLIMLLVTSAERGQGIICQHDRNIDWLTIWS